MNSLASTSPSRFEIDSSSFMMDTRAINKFEPYEEAVVSKPVATTAIGASFYYGAATPGRVDDVKQQPLGQTAAFIQSSQTYSMTCPSSDVLHSQHNSSTGSFFNGSAPQSNSAPNAVASSTKKNKRSSITNKNFTKI